MVDALRLSTLLLTSSHSRKSGNPDNRVCHPLWTPACAGVTVQGLNAEESRCQALAQIPTRVDAGTHKALLEIRYHRFLYCRAR